MPKHQPGVSRRYGLLHRHSLVQTQDKPSGSSNKSPSCEEARRIPPEIGQKIPNTMISFRLLHRRICKRTCCIWVRRSLLALLFLGSLHSSAPWGLLTVGIGLFPPPALLPWSWLLPGLGNSEAPTPHTNPLVSHQLHWAHGFHFAMPVWKPHIWPGASNFLELLPPPLLQTRGFWCSSPWGRAVPCSLGIPCTGALPIARAAVTAVLPHTMLQIHCKLHTPTEAQAG